MIDKQTLETSSTYNPQTIKAIQERAELGRYLIRGYGAFRNVPRFDDLVFLTASLTRFPLEGYREKCQTKTVLGTRYAKRPMELEIPITIAGMSFGALSRNAKVALGQAATLVGTSTTTGDGGMLPAEREASSKLVYQCLPSRYGFNVKDLKKADAIEIVVGQGAKPGGGGLLLGQKVSKVVAGMRTLPEGVDQRSPCRHPDWVGADDLRIKIEELREATDWQIPIYVKMGATRVKDDVKLAVKAGADVVVLDGMEGGTAATQSIFQEHTGIPTLPALAQAVEALKELDVYGEVQLVISGGIRSGPDVAKALALGADAVSLGTATLIAMGCNKPVYIEDYHKLGTEPYHCHHCHTGMCPVGITTQDEELMQRLPVEQGRIWVANYLQSMMMEVQSLARACGKSDIHNLEREDLVALTLEASAMTKLPLAGTDFVMR
ncbi:FMN-binding glutamate synthase family protein [Myxosarcina sp. GI1]|uniref:FMN-binding glutamate synthase family protein n=1 Tax=Myxosarcina sp. GI1 TaxID=1541065 RepID=UPI000566FC9F|nr:FMN-binding glutamate synthase family protein [Myxosarcina sp. GI1]